MPRPSKEERTCPECGSTNTYRIGYRAANKFHPLTKRICLSCKNDFIQD